jgi:glutaminyl-tRNA synthetase
MDKAIPSSRSRIPSVRWSLFRIARLYDWFIDKLEIFPSRQYEFARLNLNYTVMSKRKLLQLVNEGYVTGWDDPRMPTISGLRRRGYTPESIRVFAERIGVQKRDNLIDVSLAGVLCPGTPE